MLSTQPLQEEEAPNSSLRQSMTEPVMPRSGTSTPTKAPAAARAGARQLGRDSWTAGRQSSPHLRQPPSELTSNREPWGAAERLTLRLLGGTEPNINLVRQSCGEQQQQQVEGEVEWRKHGSVDITAISVPDCSPSSLYDCMTVLYYMSHHELHQSRTENRTLARR